MCTFRKGDEVPANFTVAQVGNQLIQTQVAGIIINVPDTVGAQVNAGDTVVADDRPYAAARWLARCRRTKWLSKIQVGDPVTFTVDAFGSQTFSGVVDEVSPTSEESQIVFNISDQREEQNFDVKARFDTTEYPQLKNGMSARMWIYTQ